MSLRIRVWWLLALLPLLTLAAGSELPSGVPVPTGHIDLIEPLEGIFAEEWFEVHIDGQKAGYLSQVFQREGEQVSVRSHQFMVVGRGSSSIEISSEQETVETLDGQPLRFSQQTLIAAQPVSMEGIFVGSGQVELTLQQGQAQYSNTHLIGEDSVMAWGLRRKIQQLQLNGGEEDIRIYSPDLSAETAIEARIELGDSADFDYLGQQTSGRHMVVTYETGNRPIVSEMWLDDDGRALRTSVPLGSMQMDVYLVSNEQALAAFYPPELLLETLIPLSEPIPADADSVTFKVSTSGAGGLQAQIAAGTFQTVEMLSEDEALVSVYRQTAERRHAAEKRTDPPARYRNANLLLNAEDPLIEELTRQVVATDAAADDWDRADRLRRFVTDYVEDKNLQVGFASASEVARNPEGDCSEHAVLLAAMGRAAGIPSRVAAGLAYVERFFDRDQVMGYHMWTQFWIDGQWVDFDAALEESECSPTRIALFTSGLDDATLSDIGLRLIDSIGQIQVEIIDLTRVSNNFVTSPPSDLETL